MRTYEICSDSNRFCCLFRCYGFSRRLFFLPHRAACSADAGTFNSTVLNHILYWRTFVHVLCNAFVSTYPRKMAFAVRHRQPNITASHRVIWIIASEHLKSLSPIKWNCARLSINMCSVHDGWIYSAIAYARRTVNDDDLSIEMCKVHVTQAIGFISFFQPKWTI